MKATCTFILFCGGKQDVGRKGKVHVPVGTHVRVCVHRAGPGAKYEKDRVYALRERPERFV